MITFRYILSLVLLVPALSFGGGLAVYPMEQFVFPGKPVVYTASNGQDKAIAVEVLVEEWTITEDGEEVSQKSDDLIAFPSQFILKGHTSKRVKVGTREKAPVEKEKAYRVTISELPVTFEVSEEELSQVYMANAYRTSFYVQPMARKSQLELSDSSWADGILSVQFQNKGNVHTHLRDPELILNLSDGSQLVIEDSEPLDPLAGQNLHAQMARRFQINLKEKVTDSQHIVGAILKLENAQDGQAQTFNLAF